MGAHRRTVGVVLTASGLVAAVGALAIGDGREAADWGPRTVPLLAAGALLIAGLADALSSRRSPDVPAETGRRNASGTPSPTAAAHESPVGGAAPDAGSTRQVLALIGVFALYALLMARTGYVFSTAVAAVAAFALFGLRRPLALAAVAVLCPLALHVIFFELLGVFPPRGRWFDLLDWLPQ